MSRQNIIVAHWSSKKSEILCTKATMIGRVAIGLKYFTVSLLIKAADLAAHIHGTEVAGGSWNRDGTASHLSFAPHALSSNLRSARA